MARAKANPGKLTYGSAGTGGITHLATELLKHEAGIDLLHVPYRGAAPATNDLIAGTVDCALLDVPVLLLAQLNRPDGKGDPGDPQLTNLRESGGLEQDADAVMFVYRESVYTGENEREAEILVEKSRHGTTGTVKLRFDGPSVRFGGVVG